MPGDPVLSRLFRENLAPEVALEPCDDARLEAALSELLAAARAAWPTFTVAAETFIPYVASRLPDDASSIDALAEMRGSDLYLACACAHGDDRAIAIFDAEYLGPIFPLPRQLAAISLDVRQLASMKLFVREGSDPPKIADYSGRGDLGSWVSVVTLRIGLSLLRGTKRELPLDETALFELGATGDAEVAQLKKRYSKEFADAFHHALGTLAPRDRNLLRQHYVDALTMEQIGRIYRVHRITIVRWIDKARAKLAIETRRHLETRLGISRGELESIMRLIRSQMDVSLRTYLR
jgi:RNA polymerase sigma-70 factor (ECF subfamily)